MVRRLVLCLCALLGPSALVAGWLFLWPSPIFQIDAGKTYLVLHDCLPQVGCFAGVVQVVAVDTRSGWFQVAGGLWINLNAGAGMREMPPAQTPVVANPSLRVELWTNRS